jgi:hypothetical protein
MDSSEGRALRERIQAYARFDAWAASHPRYLLPGDAVAAAGRLYELLPPASRHRPVDPHGVMNLHRLLRRAFHAR